MADHAPTEYECAALSSEALLVESQTDRTPKHSVSFAWAEAALEKAGDSPAWRGHVLAQMAIRATLAGFTPSLSHVYLTEAHGYLNRPEAQAEPREFATVAIAAVRIAGIHLAFNDRDNARTDRARAWAEEARSKLITPEQLRSRARVDRYLTMLLRHAAVMEELAGQSDAAEGLANLALRCARRAKRGNDSPSEHRQFVEVQAAKAQLALDWLAMRRARGTNERTHEEYLLLQQLLGEPDLMRKP